MVSPCSMSSRQIEHSPLSLASTSAVGQDKIKLTTKLLADERKQQSNKWDAYCYKGEVEKSDNLEDGPRFALQGTAWCRRDNE